MIKVLTNYQYGAPQIDRNAGSLINILDKALISGFGESALDSMSMSGSTVTATINAGNPYKDGDILHIDCSGQSEYVGDFVIYNCSNTQFLFDTETTSAPPASGSMTAKIAPLDWVQGMSGTNKQIYIPGEGHQKLYLFEDNGENDLYPYNVRIEAYDSCLAGTDVATVDIFESMLDIDNGLPASNFRKNFILKEYKDYVESGDKPWVIIGNNKQFYLLTSPQKTNTFALQFEVCFFGQFPSYVPGDINNSVICARSASLTADVPYFTQWCRETVNNKNAFQRIWDVGQLGLNIAYGGAYALRDYSGTIAKSNIWLSSGATGTSSNTGWSATSAVEVNGCDMSVYYHPIYLAEERGIRGVLPGAYCSINKIVCPLPGGTRKQDIVTINGTERQLQSWSLSSTSAYTFDITGPWE